MPVTDDTLDAASAERLARATRAAQDLCAVLWEVLQEELSDRAHAAPRARRVAELSERVAAVSSTVAALVHDATGARPARESSPRAGESPLGSPHAGESPLGFQRAGESPLGSPHADEFPLGFEPAAAPGPVATPTPRVEVVIVDEREEAQARPADPVRPPVDLSMPSGVAERPGPRMGQTTQPRPLPWDEPPPREVRVTRRNVDRASADKPA
jgi:hypothetical protein